MGDMCFFIGQRQRSQQVDHSVYSRLRGFGAEMCDKRKVTNKIKFDK